MKNKYYAINNAGLQSKKNDKRYAELLLLQRAGVIKDLQKDNITYTLMEGFEFQGKRERAIKYTPDFVYFDLKANVQVIEEVKSKITAKIRDYPLRRKLFKQYILKNIPNCKFHEIIL